MPNSKGVIINIYKESKNPKPNHKNNPMIKKINPKLSILLSSKARRVLKIRAYDRRAQLLAYTQELRHANIAQQEQQCTFNNSRPKPKKWTHKMRVFFSRCYGMRRRWNYEPIVTDDYCDDMNQERVKKSKKRTRIYSQFCNKLRCYLKKIWQCKNGGCS